MKRLLPIIFLLMLVFAEDVASNLANEKLQAEISVAITKCMADGIDCDCNDFPSEVRGDCQESQAKIKSQVEAMAEDCLKDETLCTCQKLDIPEEAMSACEKERERLVGEVKRFRSECIDDITSCDCSSIENERGQEICRQNIEKAKNCMADPFSSDCDYFQDEAIKSKVEAERNKIRESVYPFIVECVKNPDKCDCSVIENDVGRKFCEVQTDRAEKCIVTELSEDCLKLDDTPVAPEDLPEQIPKFIRNFLSKTIKEKVATQRQQAFDETMRIVSACMEDPSKCDCSQVKIEGMNKFCLEQTQLMKECYADYGSEACEKLDNRPYLPEGMPEFVRPFAEKIVSDGIKAKKSEIIKEASTLISDCVDEPDKCDCSKVPESSRTFCENKKAKWTTCKYDYDIDVCMELEKEDVLPSSVPPFMRGVILQVISPLIESKRAKYHAMAVEMAKDVAVSCIEDPKSCECEKMPIQSRAWCGELRENARGCIDEDLLACERWETMDLIPPGVPEFIKSQLRPMVEKKVAEKKKELMPKECEGLTTRECIDIMMPEECKGMTNIKKCREKVQGQNST